MSTDTAKRAAAFAMEHLAEDISVADIADHLGYSPFHFNRMFAAATRTPPGRFLAALRFHAAKNLLLTGDNAVVDVCTQVGFTSVSSFTRRFREAVGTSPAAFRTLADQVADRSPAPFSIGDPKAAHVTINIDAPPSGLRLPPLMWIGWFPTPAPIGLPLAGVLCRGQQRIRLPLCAGAPWLLGFSVDAASEVVDHLAPSAPVVAVHRQPVTSAQHITLTFGPAPQPSVPMLPALPMLAPSR
ncbi:helix-turn-helix transcriptional regulator [Brevibacterium luteolum]|uniref:helix-turn-helix transcriptional regulator n=1 Tax=Brevibacterium luteolum TaxID=199591 RepID=UPI00223BABD5|nr:helix-turn-helix transcriptional regulator [Brevibacterium luteolum]MCT1829667.1 helix-turn-helix transcriptional regulator [Brevibacterium luteolum]